MGFQSWLSIENLGVFDTGHVNGLQNITYFRQADNLYSALAVFSRIQHLSESNYELGHGIQVVSPLSAPNLSVEHINDRNSAQFNWINFSDSHDLQITTVNLEHYTGYQRDRNLFLDIRGDISSVRSADDETLTIIKVSDTIRHPEILAARILSQQISAQDFPGMLHILTSSGQ